MTMNEMQTLTAEENSSTFSEPKKANYMEKKNRSVWKG